MNGKATFVALQTGTPVLLWGKPGIGKSSWVQMAARATGLPLETVIASIREPSDFAGLPVITSEDNVRLSPPDWAVRLKEAGEGILFLDEISTAPPAVQSALLRVVLERIVGDIEIPQDVYIIAAANPTDTSSGTWTLSAALANRFIHVDWGVESKRWVEGMIDGWSVKDDINLLPENWEDGIKYTRSMVASFIQANPRLLLNEPDNADLAGRAWPSPRTWDIASRLLTACRAAGLSKEMTLGLMAGCVGDGPASEYLTWERQMDLPDPESLLANPKKFKVPKRADQTFAIMSSVVVAAKEDLTQERWGAAWEIMGIAAKEGHADIAAIPAKSLARAKTDKLDVPHDVKEFVPVLSAAGLIK